MAHHGLFTRLLSRRNQLSRIEKEHILSRVLAEVAPDRQRRTRTRWLAIGFGYTFVKVTAKILLQRLGSDETLGRVVGALWSARLAATAIGSIIASALVALGSRRGEP